MSSHSSVIKHTKWAQGAAEYTDTTMNKTLAPQLHSSETFSTAEVSSGMGQVINSGQGP
jgi:hypothetical protein